MHKCNDLWNLPSFYTSYSQKTVFFNFFVNKAQITLHYNIILENWSLLTAQNHPQQQKGRKLKWFHNLLKYL